MEKQKEFMTTLEVAETLGISPYTLREWRAKRKGPNYFRTEGKFGRVRYRPSDVAEYIRQRMVEPEKEQASKK